MRHKYLITQDGSQKKLKIMEYAVIDKNQKNLPSAMLEKGGFSFRCQETYASDQILHSMSKGIEDLVTTLRTRNMFPIRPFAIKIAESVTALYKSGKDGSVELFFDDIDSTST